MIIACYSMLSGVWLFIPVRGSKFGKRTRTSRDNCRCMVSISLRGSRFGEALGEGVAFPKFPSPHGEVGVESSHLNPSRG